MSDDQRRVKNKSQETQEQRPTNATYERALATFFDESGPSSEQRALLPDDVGGLSIKRSQLITLVKETDSDSVRLNALIQLRQTTGLPRDPIILIHSLVDEPTHLCLDALHQLEEWLSFQELKGLKVQMIERLELLEVRSFNSKIQSGAARCLALIKNNDT